MAKKTVKKENKPIIETMINTSALALTAAGTNILIANHDKWGFIFILFGAGLEFLKYYGRKIELW